MAATMKLCWCLSRWFWNFAIFSAILSAEFAYLVHSETTTMATTTTAANTESSSTVTSTTTVPPTTTASNQPKTLIGNTAIGQCLCDLTGNACDINCCCDKDCTATDVSTFQCDPTSVTIDNKLCFQENFFLFTNSPATTKKDASGLFCIYFDNYKERNYYLDPNFVQDLPTFSDYINKYATVSIQQPVSVTEPVFTLNSFYKAGDTVYVVYANEAQGNMVFPDVFSNGQCNDRNPMAYLVNKNATCTRDVGTLNAATCMGTNAFNAASYYDMFRVVKTPGLFGYIVNGTFVGVTTTTMPPTTSTILTTTAAGVGNNGTSTVSSTVTMTPMTTPATSVNPSLIQTLYNNTYTIPINVTARTHQCLQTDRKTLQDCTFVDIPSASFDNNGGLCNNVTQEVHYFVTTSGTLGITKVEVQFVFASINMMRLTQKFSVTFNSLNGQKVTVAKSGNPGYVFGKPLLYGTLNTTSQEISIEMDPNRGMSMIVSSPNGECSRSTTTRVPVRFGENMRTGCTIRLNLTNLNCAGMQQEIVDTLDGPNVPDTNHFVATFGNTTSQKIGDWVRIIIDGRPTAAKAQFSVNSETCLKKPPMGMSKIDYLKKAIGTDTCSLSMGLHIQVLYASVGALANPQRKILGVAFLYDTFKNVKYRCVGMFCQDNNRTQVFEISQTVSFVDVSQPTTKFQGVSPVLVAHLPNDFFYPFLYYTSGSISMHSFQWTLSQLCILLATFFGVS